MFQDIFPHKYDNHYKPDAVPAPSARVLCYEGKGGYLGADGTHMTYAEYRARGGKGPLTYLFSIDETEYYLCTEDFPAGTDYVLEDNVRSRTDLPADTVFAHATGASLDRWYRSNRFCGRCGGKMEHSKKERAMVCPSCGMTVYPRISPVAIVGITNGDRIVCSKYKRGYARWALIAGFSEIGEPIEDTVRREVMEETGLRVKNLRYFNCQPWPYSDSMLFGFFCDVDGDDTITVEEDELAEARWFSRDEMPVQESLFSLTATMMEAFRTGNYPK